MSAEFDSKNFINISEEDERLWELLSAYVDGETTLAEAAIVEAHLRSDAAYAQDFAFMKATARQVVHVGDVMPPTELRSLIFAATIHKPTLIRRFAQAMGQLQSAISPRHALPIGALAAGVLAAFVFVPRTADNRSESVSTEPSIVAVAPHTNKVVTPNMPKPTVPKGTQEKPKIAKNDNQPMLALPIPPDINFENLFIGTPVRENVKTVVAKKSDVPKAALTLASSIKKTPSITPKLNSAAVTIKTPMPKTSDMFDDFTPVPNMDRENQRAIVRNDPESLPNEDITPNSADTTPTTNALPSANVESPTRTFRVRSTRTLPDSRRIATAAQFRTEQSEFQQGISRSTMLAMQRDELSGSTVTRF